MAKKHLRGVNTIVMLSAAILLFAIHPANAQAFPPGNSFRIASDFSGLCWDAPRPHGNGSAVNQYPCHIGGNQTWKLHSRPNGFQIALDSGRFCVGLTGDKLALRACKGAPVWEIHRGRADARRIDKIVRATIPASNRCVEVPGRVLTSVQLQVAPCGGGLDQSWLILICRASASGAC